MQTHTIEINTTFASDAAIVELEDEIRTFLNWLTSFKYHSITEVIDTGEKTYLVKSVNP